VYGASWAVTEPYDAAVETPTSDLAWHVERVRGPAHDLHHLEVAPRRTMLVLEAQRPALVLGSTQHDSVADPAALARAGVDLVRRRSGGGAVLLVPGEHVWVDLVVPAGDPLWLDDVRSSSWWLGEAWAAALAAAAPHALRAEVHRGPVTNRELAGLVCFAGLGPGEVAVAGAKLVGLSQRRTRSAARLQCLVHRRVDPAATTELLAPSVRSGRLDGVLAESVTDLAALGLDPGWDVVEGLRAQLP
jgi:lipoate-protein ligase A